MSVEDTVGDVDTLEDIDSGMVTGFGMDDRRLEDGAMAIVDMFYRFFFPGGGIPMVGGNLDAPRMEGHRKLVDFFADLETGLGGEKEFPDRQPEGPGALKPFPG